MMNKGFWGLAALTLVLLAHSVYLWQTTTRGRTLQPSARAESWWPVDCCCCAVQPLLPVSC